MKPAVKTAVLPGNWQANLKKSNLKAYRVLHNLVKQTLLRGQQIIEALKVQTYWQTGAYINEHVRLNGARAGYGKQVFVKLAGELKVDQTVLERVSRFAAKFPNWEDCRQLAGIARKPASNKGNSSWKMLSWSHFRVLITIEDDTVRRRLAGKAARGGWRLERLEDEVWKLRARSKKISYSGNADSKELLTPQLGKLNTRQLASPSKIHWPAENGLMFDHGFKTYTWLTPEKVKGLGAGDIVEVKNGRLVPAKGGSASGGKSERTARGLFTYLAYVDYVIDGDTLWVALDTGLGGVSRQKLRLRGIDAPEIKTASGRRAYEFLKAALAKAPYLIVRSSKNDKYDRYETDLFIPAENPSSGKTGAGRSPSVLELKDLVFINNLLLERGFAVRMEE